jgi:hypothetical protein
VELDLVQRLVLVGSLVPTNSRLPRLNNGRTWCLRSSFLLDQGDRGLHGRGKRIHQRHAEFDGIGRRNLRPDVTSRL